MPSIADPSRPNPKSDVSACQSSHAESALRRQELGPTLLELHRSAICARLKPARQLEIDLLAGKDAQLIDVVVERAARTLDRDVAGDRVDRVPAVGQREHHCAA